MHTNSGSLFNFFWKGRKDMSRSFSQISINKRSKTFEFSMEKCQTSSISKHFSQQKSSTENLATFLSIDGFELTYCELSQQKFKPNGNANELTIIFYGRIGMFKHTVFRLKGLIQFSGRLPEWELSNFIASLSTMMSIITIIISVILMNSRKFELATKRNAMEWLFERWCGWDWKQYVLLCTEKEPVERIKDHLSFAATMLHD